MSDLLNWVTTYGESLSVVSILLIVIGVGGVGLYKKWWVPGWMYTDCVQKKSALEKAADEETDRMRLRLSVLEGDAPSSTGRGSRR